MRMNAAHRPPRGIIARLVPYAVSIAFIAAVAAPMFGPTRSDSFPLSTYPMFSGRQSPEANIPHAIAVSHDGERSVLPPSAIFNDEVIQAIQTLRQAIAAGTEATLDLCEQIAARAGPDAARVEIVTDRYNAIDYFRGDKTPLASTLHAECEVPGP